MNLYAYAGNEPIGRNDPTGWDWVYNQDTGTLSHYRMNFARLPSALETMEPTVVLNGYAGGAGGRDPSSVNNPSMDNVQGVGPLPRGRYEIEESFRHPSLGSVAMRLTPDEDNEMHGRSLFLIHGDNSRANNSGSEGCIVLCRTDRELVSGSDDRVLWVIGGDESFDAPERERLQDEEDADMERWFEEFREEDDE